ncbi:hypothetical protein MSAN_01311000 [Mycena sanguinolenta]|uniref:Uncharacterized protein n=1 Tax=Mycena sanguinolenta TaxID=230812 RepID=A0A8H7D397_9AGAR|nr:hypothetical protein MSAN_01311000 [Mycena sanguinolenta]
MRHRHLYKSPTVVERPRYSPPRNRLNSEMGIIDATTLILLQKMMADSYEHGRVVWKENRAQCARTGETESDDLPCGPNSSQKKVEAWLVEAGLLAPDVPDERETDAETPSPELPVPPAPQTPRRRPWHRLEIIIPRKSGPKSSESSCSSLTTNLDSSSSLKSPRSPLSPIKLWSAVQRGTSAIPVPVVRRKPNLKRTQSSPPPTAVVELPVRRKCVSLENPPSWVPRPVPEKQPVEHDTLLATAFKRAVMLETITDDDVEAILRRHRDPLPDSPATSKPKPKAKPRLQFDDLASYPIRWPEPIVSPSPPSFPNVIEIAPRISCPDVRWYHLAFLVFLWHFLIISFSGYILLRVVFKPLVCMTLVYCGVVFSQFLLSFF